MEESSYNTALNLINIGYQTDLNYWKLMFTIILVLLNGFFVAAEFAIVKVRSSQLEINKLRNKYSLNAAKKIVSNLDSYLAATQLGVTIASLGLGWVGESSIRPFILFFLKSLHIQSDTIIFLYNKISLVIAFILITFLHIIFGELAPKSLAISFPDKTTLSVSIPLRIFYFLFRPIIFIMNKISNMILCFMGVNMNNIYSDIHTEEELKVIINESTEKGQIEETEGKLIQNVFEFDDRRVVNIQTNRKNVSAINIDFSVKQSLDYVINEGYSRYPVYKGSIDNIVGIIYTKDLIKKFLRKPSETSILSLLRDPIFIPENALIKNVLKQFQKRRMQIAIVTNEVGEVAGVVSMEDILEELVGDIQDEFDNEDPIVFKLSDDSYIVNAHNTINDINRHLPVKFDQNEHYDTLAGLISYLNEGLEIKEDDIVNVDNYKGKVLKMYRNSVEKIQLFIKKKI